MMFIRMRRSRFLLSAPLVFAASFCLALWLSTRSVSEANVDPMPALEGEAAVSYLKDRGLYDSLQSAINAQAPAIYSVTIDPLLFTQVKKLTASDAAPAEGFGTSVAVSGDTAVVGASFDSVTALLRGAAYIVERNTGGADNWGEVRKLTASDGAQGDQFGTSVAISGDTVIVGAFAADSVYIFNRNLGGTNNWGELKKLTGSDGLGVAVSISGETLVAGASFDSSFRGAAHVFERNRGGADNWGEVKKITASDRAANDFFGASVGISGDTVIVGAHQDDSLTGSAYIFERGAGGADNWGEVRKLTASDGAPGDEFGTAAAIFQDTAIVGIVGPFVNSRPTGAAYIFDRDSGGVDNWGELKILTGSDAGVGGFGESVAISGDIAIVGSFVIASNKGAAYIFERNTGGAGNWGETQKIVSGDAAPNAEFGRSVTIDGNAIIVGAVGDVGLRGSAYVFGVDTISPVITCPTNVIATGTQGSSSATVTYPPPVATDNLALASVVCLPPSGSLFPAGTTTVTCTATDTSGNTAHCSFNVTVFDVRLQDDSDAGRFLLFISSGSQAGEYRFSCGGVIKSGRGVVTAKGNIFTLTHNAGDRRVQATADKVTGRGSASLQSPPGSVVCSITDRNIRAD